MITIDNAFEIGQRVFLKTDIDQYEHIVTEIRVTSSGVMYLIMFYTTGSLHYECELSYTADVLIKTGATRKR
jgi:hypothetical protein